ncbi:hypothetical protein E1264_17785 [Actinomadura sp. KC216]|uniref:hypothetical protein n=1 Tax=Actinomadura sp. KC216 TaxID=2530370 RepID=UPI00104B24EB|nr:hypothetical protein [Actinomadura sp. KC216]TDB86450.1 hypothetical protein E1264_17785 [Actinomadura sp. KC216]
MIVTHAARDTIPARLRRTLDDLADRWPVGMTVRHRNGWTGQVVPDFAGNVHGLDLPGAAHCLTGEGPGDVAVCVEATINGHVATVWYRPSVLSLSGKSRPAPKPSARQRQRTRRVS